MQIFEFYFNPKLKKNLIFNSFCYEPENVYEKNLGGLYMAGFLKNVLPQNVKFLEKIHLLAKERYYKSLLSSSPEKNLKETLKEMNKFLEEIAKRGNVSWLGNLGFAILSLKTKKDKNIELNFTKTGEIKMVLLREGEITDIDKKLRLQDIEPYPLKIFSNIVSGKLIKNDLILVQNKEIFDFFQNQNLLNKIAQLNPFTEKGFRKILDEKKEELAKITGICLIISLNEGALFEKKETISPKIKKEFSLNEFFLNPLISLKKSFLKKIYLIKKSSKTSRHSKIKSPSFINIFKNKKTWFSLLISGKKILLNDFKRKSFLIGGLIIVLLIGFSFSQVEKKEKMRKYENILEEVQKKVYLADSYLILNDSSSQEKASQLLDESLTEIHPVSKDLFGLPQSFTNQISSLENSIIKKLEKINKWEKIENPEIVFEFEPGLYIPHRILALKNNLYFFSPYSNNIFQLDSKRKGKILSIENKFNLGTTFNESLLLFTKPNQLTVIKEGEINSSFFLDKPYDNFDFYSLSSFLGNLYFLDKKTGEIIKYPLLKNFQWAKPEIWSKKSTFGKSIAVDGSVWILEKENIISQYYAGNFKNKIKLNLYPRSIDFSKIFSSASLPYLYILEPVQKRIIITEKTGRVVKQYQSDKFDNLLDFAVSEDGKTIWLLNGLRLYQLNI